MNTLFQIAFAAAGLLADKTGQATITQTGGVYANGCYTYGAAVPNAIYAKLPPGNSLAGGLQLEFVCQLSEIPDGDGLLVVKDKTIAAGFNSGKLKIGWLKGANDPYNSSTDQINGLVQLPLNQKMTIRLAYEAERGMVVTSIDGVEDRRRYRFFGAGEIGNDGNSVFQFFKGMKNFKVWSITAYSGAPTLATPGMECYLIRDTLGRPNLVFDKIHSSLMGATVRVVKEGRFGASANLDLFTLAPPSPAIGGGTRQARVYDLAGFDIGDTYLRITASKSGKLLWQGEKNFYLKPDLKMPKRFVRGVYHVRQADFKTVKELGATDLYCDWTIINNGPWQALGAFLDSAKANGLGMVVAGSYQARTTGNMTYATNHPAMTAWYSVDEAAGNYRRLERNYWAMNATGKTEPVIVNLNNFTRIEEAAECADILMVNVYMHPRNSPGPLTPDGGALQYDVVKKAAALKPTWLVMPQYDNIQWTISDYIDVVDAGLAAGAKGIWFFEWDHRKGQTGYYTSETGREIMREVFDYLKSKGL